MIPALLLLLAVMLSATARTLLGRQHPLVVVPAIGACGIWYQETRGEPWQWVFLTLGAVIAVAALRLALARLSYEAGGTDK
jgi:hypothetical protein